MSQPSRKSLRGAERLGALLIVAILLLSASDRCVAQTYRLTVLGTLGDWNSGALGINNAGQVVGYADSSRFWEGSLPYGTVQASLALRRMDTHSLRQAAHEASTTTAQSWVTTSMAPDSITRLCGMEILLLA